MDYFHYAYQCPYLTGTEEHIVHCEGGCRIVFTAVADTRRFLQAHCADTESWKHCYIALAKTDRIERNLETKKRIKRWQEKEKQKRR